MSCRYHQKMNAFLVAGRVKAVKNYPDPGVSTKSFGRPITWHDKITVLGVRFGDIEEQVFRAYRFSDDTTGFKTELKSGRLPKAGENVLLECFPKNEKSDKNPCIGWIEVVGE